MLALAALLLLSPAQDQAKSDAAKSADAFALQLPAGQAAVPTPADQNAAQSAVPAADAPAAPVTTPVFGFTLDTPIKDLIADPGAKAVLDRDLPGLSSDSNLPKFQDLSLRRFQPLTGGQLTDALLARVAKDLTALATTAPVTSDTPPPPDKRLPQGR